MSKKLLIIIAVASAALAVPVLRSVLGGSDAFEVEFETLAPRSIQASVLASGTLVHEEEVELTTEEIGKVTEIFVEEGDRVARGSNHPLPSCFWRLRLF